MLYVQALARNHWGKNHALCKVAKEEGNDAAVRQLGTTSQINKTGIALRKGPAARTDKPAGCINARQAFSSRPQ